MRFSLIPREMRFFDMFEQAVSHEARFRIFELFQAFFDCARIIVVQPRQTLFDRFWDSFFQRFFDFVRQDFDEAIKIAVGMKREMNRGFSLVVLPELLNQAEFVFCRKDFGNELDQSFRHPPGHSLTYG